MVSFAALADIHSGRTNLFAHQWDYLLRSKEAVVGKQIDIRLKKAIRVIQDTGVDFVVILGDLTESALNYQFLRVKKIIESLRIPVILIAGNHDLGPYIREANRKVIWEAKEQLSIEEIENRFPNWKNCFDNFISQENHLQNYGFTCRNTKFIIVDNMNREPFLGFPGTSYFSVMHQASKQWLESQLADSEEKTIIIFSHAPLRMGWLQKTVRACNAENKIIAAICGHSHRWKKKQRGNIARITVGALYIERKILITEVADDILFLEKRI